MAENQHEELRPEGIIPYGDFERTARTVMEFSGNKIEYNRSMRQYTTELIYCGVRGYGYGATKEAAQQNTIRRTYAAYRQRVWRENTMIALKPKLKAAELRLKNGLAAYGVKLSKFDVSWYYNREYQHRWLDKRNAGRWMIQISIDYEISLSAKSFKKGYSSFMALPGDILAKLDKESNSILRQDFTTIRWIAKHENHLDWLAKQYRRHWEAIPMIPVSEAKPGDVLVEQYGRNYFEVVSVSKTGAKIMVHWFNNPEGPQQIKRLKKAETEDKYKRITYAEWRRHMDHTRNRIVLDAIEAAQKRIEQQ